MNTRFVSNGQLLGGYLAFPGALDQSFVNTDTYKKYDEKSGKEAYFFHGKLTSGNPVCAHCNCMMHKHQTYQTKLKHITIGESPSYIICDVNQYRCPICKNTKCQSIPFKANEGYYTNALKTQVTMLFIDGSPRVKDVSNFVNLNRKIVKSINHARMLAAYADGKNLKKPIFQAKRLAIDEFLLRDGYNYATVIIDLDTGIVLWICEGKQKEVVTNFIKYVGKEYMDNVEVVACDMNAAYSSAFKEECPHIKITYDHFHLIKKYNDDVVSNTRKDEEKRLRAEGKLKEAKEIKGSRYIVTSNYENLKRKDKKYEEIKNGKDFMNRRKKHAEGIIQFQGIKKERKQRESAVTRLKTILENNKKLYETHVIKSTLDDFYEANSYSDAKAKLDHLITLCGESENSHVLKFKKTLVSKYDGILEYANFKVTTGKLEGINNKIKTIRRNAYGYRDFEYFFLNIIDSSMKNHAPHLRMPPGFLA